MFCATVHESTHGKEEKCSFQTKIQTILLIESITGAVVPPLYG